MFAKKAAISRWNMKCKECANYMAELDTCKFCSFEKRDSSQSPFDIFELCDTDFDFEIIQKHLKDNGIGCLTVDTWSDLDMMVIIGCTARVQKVADVLRVHREVIYDWNDHGLLIVNLFEEKWLRGML